MDGSVLGDASVSLQKMLEAAVKAAFPHASVALDSPKDAAPDAPGDAVVSLWLYSVTRQPDAVNLPPRRIAPDRVEAQRLSVELHYLLTPLGADMITRQRILGVALQAMQTNTILTADRLEPGLAGLGIDALRVHLESLPIDELARVWTALTEPYQLSVAYEVSFVPLPAGDEPIAVSPVLDRRVRFDQIVGTGAVGV